jgi:hypothetical protein
MSPWSKPAAVGPPLDDPVIVHPRRPEIEHQAGVAFRAQVAITRGFTDAPHDKGNFH